MDENVPDRSDAAPPRPASPARPPWWRRWFGWLFGTDLDGPPNVLGSRRSARPPLPLADAYARPGAARATSLPAVRAEWTVREPIDRTDPVPHEQCEFAVASRVASAPGDQWRLLAASVRGKYHAHAALWRDDAFAWGTAGPWTVLAVADGAGSAPLSRVAAAVACAEGVRALREKTADVPPGLESADRLRAALAVAMLRAREAVRCEAEKRRRPEREFHTTCLLVVHASCPGGDVVGGLQVGDGAIGLYHDDGTCLVLGEADHGAYASETRFLTTPRIDELGGGLDHRAVVVVRPGLRAVAVMTDGVADDFFPEKTRLAELFRAPAIPELKSAQGEALCGVLDAQRGPTRDPREGRALVEWLRYEKRGSSDDRTLVLLYRAEGDAA